MAKRLIILCFVLSNLSVYAQEHEPLGTALYFELVGKGFMSANVDFSIGGKTRLTLGLTMLDHEFAKEDMEEEYPVSTLPTPSVMLIQLFGKERHYFEAGVGLSLSPVPWKEYSENDSILSLHGVLGYRYQVSKKFFFRAGLTPFYRINYGFLPLPGLSFGYSW